mmetsp:Transcript_16379/g.45627  ORF Transcript_16379/g.45627 Transcript_16379/m.45627 type:complete len:323 (-) Transcript_16379:986-1954(-)
MSFGLRWLGMRCQPQNQATKGLAVNWFQVSTVLVLTVLTGAALQIVKLSIVDAAGREFQQQSYGSKAAYLLPFGVTKAVANLLVGHGSDKFGRKTMECSGWVVGFFVPLFLVLATLHGSFATAIVASAFLGAQQGLSWSAAIFAAVDLALPEQRGLAVGLTETAGYTSVAVFAYVYTQFEGLITCQMSESMDRLSEINSGCAIASNGGVCRTADDWDPACLGLCTCSGYMALAAKASSFLMGAGLAISMFVLKESSTVYNNRRQQAEGPQEDGIELTDTSQTLETVRGWPHICLGWNTLNKYQLCTCNGAASHITWYWRPDS